MFFICGGSVSDELHLGKRALAFDVNYAALRSGIGRLLALVRFGRDMLACGGADVQGRAGLAHRLRTAAEEHPALRRKLRSFRDHAGRDTVDIRNFRTAEPEGIRLAGLLLLGRVGLARRWQ